MSDPRPAAARRPGGGPGIAGLAHVGIAVRALPPAIERWTTALGFTLAGEETIESMGLSLAFLRAGDLTIELLAPTRGDSVVARFLEKRGEGIHHLSVLVPDIEAALAQAAAAGLELIDRTPRDGGHGTKIAFLHPRAMFGVLLEFCERREP